MIASVFNALKLNQLDAGKLLRNKVSVVGKSRNKMFLAKSVTTLSFAESLHLKTGSKCPAKAKGKLRIYNMRFCPYAQRPILVALAKGIPMEIVNCNLMNKPEFLWDKNPNGKVPVSEEDDGKIVYESLIVSDYLDAKYGGRRLQSEDPYNTSLDRMLISDYEGKFISSFNKILIASRNGLKEGITFASLIENIYSSLEKIEQELCRRKTKFLFSNQHPGIVDYMIWPWLERLPILKEIFEHSYDFERAETKIPTYITWTKEMMKDKAVKEYFIKAEDHLEFFRSLAVKNPNYDILALRAYQ